MANIVRVTGTSLFDEIHSDAIQKTIGDIVDGERREDIRKIGKAWDFYYGEQEQYVRQYRGEKDDEYQDKDKPTLNYTKLVVNEYIEGVFGQGTKCTFKDEKHQTIWEDISSAGTFFNFDAFMVKAQRIAEISKLCVIMLRFDKTTNRVYFEDVRGELVKIYPKEDDPKQIGGILIKYLFDTGSESGERFKQRIEIWTEEKGAVYVLGPKEDRLTDNNRIWQAPNLMRDEWGRPTLPLVLLTPEEDDNTFYGISGINDIVTINEIYNNLWMSLTRMAVYQSFSVLFLKTEGQIELTLAPTRYVEADGENDDLKYVTPDAKINEVNAVLKAVKDELLDLSKVPKHVLSGTAQASPESGYALRIKRMPIESVWQNRRNTYRCTVSDLMAKTIIFHNINMKRAIPKPGEISERTIEYNMPYVPLNVQEQQMQDTFDLQHGIQTEVDLMLRKYPNLTREQAKSKLMENIDETNEINEKRAELMPGEGEGGGFGGGGISPEMIQQAEDELEE